MDTLRPRCPFLSNFFWDLGSLPGPTLGAFLFGCAQRAALGKRALSARCDNFHQGRRLYLFSLDIGETKRPKGLPEG